MKNILIFVFILAQVLNLTNQSCTGQHQDPYSSGQYVECCEGFKSCLKQWWSGAWFFRCEKCELSGCAQQNQCVKPDPPKPTCTNQGGDPHSTGQEQPCCQNTKKCLNNWSGSWHWKCMSCDHQCVQEEQKEQNCNNDSNDSNDSNDTNDSNDSNDSNVSNDCSSSLGFCLSIGLQRNKLSHQRVADIVRQAGVKCFRLYGWGDDTDLMRAIIQKVSNAKFSVELVPGRVNSCADSVSNCVNDLSQYKDLKNHVLNVLVGNEPTHDHNRRQMDYSKIHQAIRNTAQALQQLGIKASITVPFSMGIFASTWPVETSTFKSFNGDTKRILQALKDVNGKFALHPYPYFVGLYQQDLLQQSKSGGIVENQYRAALYAQKAMIGQELETMITETGWPTAGTNIASVQNAKDYLQNLNNLHQNSRSPIYKKEIYVFELFDEKNKHGAADEPNFGWYTESGNKKYSF